jgi:hypothetical protein
MMHGQQNVKLYTGEFVSNLLHCFIYKVATTCFNQMLWPKLTQYA